MGHLICGKREKERKVLYPSGLPGIKYPTDTFGLALVFLDLSSWVLCLGYSASVNNHLLVGEQRGCAGLPFIMRTCFRSPAQRHSGPVRGPSPFSLHGLAMEQAWAPPSGIAGRCRRTHAPNRAPRTLYRARSIPSTTN